MNFTLLNIQASRLTENSFVMMDQKNSSNPLAHKIKLSNATVAFDFEEHDLISKLEELMYHLDKAL